MNAPALIGRALVDCPTCKDDHVYPIDWEQVSGGWAVTLRCPNCENRWTVSPLGEETIEAFDEVLDAGTDRMVAAMRQLSRENFEPIVEAFARALELDLIGPDDFTGGHRAAAA